MCIFTPPKNKPQSLRDKALQAWYTTPPTIHQVMDVGNNTNRLVINKRGWTAKDRRGKPPFHVVPVAPPFKTFWSRLKWLILG